MRGPEHRDGLIEEQDERQIEAVVRVTQDVFGAALIGAYLHGSAVLGGLRPTSDIDVLAVIDRHSVEEERRRLIEGLMPLSGSPVAGTLKRPVELTVVTQSEVRPWRYPPRMEFQYGEWLKQDYERGFVPEPGPNPDLALVVSIVLLGNHPLVGPPPAELLDPVPTADLRAAVVAGIPELLADLEPDTRNVLLTLARIWHTVATGEMTTKDEAAKWATERLPAPLGSVMTEVADLYVAGGYGSWSDRTDEVRATAQAVVGSIEGSG